MRTIKVGVLGLLLCLSIGVSAQTEIAISAIPDSLKENATTVVRQSKTEYTWQSAATGHETNLYTVSILNERGKKNANFYCYCDKFQDLKSFSGEVYDANGKLVRKIKKSDLRFSEYSNHLASDGAYYYYECTMPYYPFTVKYEWEMKHKNGVIGYPTLRTIDGFNQSLESATYVLNIPDHIPFRHKEHNPHLFSEKKRRQEKTPGYMWEVKGVKALEYEPYGPSFASLMPRLLIAPTTFVFDGVHGDLTDWSRYGAFQYGLLEGRDRLPEAMKQKVRELTQAATDDRTKVKALYDYLAQSTRYVSIQLGIGGFQPMSASEVYATGFGDCKALSNYLRAMLQELGIPSFYTIISTTNRRLISDFASANQMNHVVLGVPLAADTLWLECTNAELPFGYVHEDIAGHDALLLKDGKGELCRLPSYPDSLNMENHTIAITLSEAGEVSAKVDYSAHLFQYEEMIGFDKLSAKEQVDALRKKVYVPQARVSNISFSEHKDPHPSVNVCYEVESNQYGSKTGSRLFLPVNAFRADFSKLSDTKKRVHDIYIRYGYQDRDIITFSFPDCYAVEALPDPVLLQKEYGTFCSLVTSDAEKNQINVIQVLRMKSGKYSAAQYEEFVQFCKAVTNGYNGKIILKRK